MSRFMDLLREAAGELLGWSEEREHLLEAEADGRMAQRTLGELGWTNLTGGTIENYFEPTREAREAMVVRAYRYFFDDPIVKQGVKVKSRYVFGKGVPIPRYRHPKGSSLPQVDLSEESDSPQDYIKRFWMDPENQVSLTGHSAQREKDEELTVQGNVFFLLYRQEGEPPETVIGPHGREAYSAPTMKITDLRSREIVEIITHPGNRKIPVFYKRVYRPRVFAFGRAGYDNTYGTYDEPTALPVVRYYRDWRFEAPTEWEGKPWGPDEAWIEKDAVMYHVAVNKTSDMRFGLTELQSVLKWAQGLNQYMTSRMQVAQAIAAIAMQAKVKGGAQAVNQVRSELSDLSWSLGEGAGGETLNLSRGDQARTKVAIGNENAKLEPMVQDTGAAGAQTDTTVFKGHVGAGLGVPVTHLGESGATNLATATSMDAPLLRMIEARQELWEEVIRDIVGYMLEGHGFDPNRVNVEMPPILQREVVGTTSMLTSMLGALDPNGSNRPMRTFVLGEVLDAMGKPNTPEIVDQLMKNAKTPFEEQKEMASLTGGRGAPKLGVDKGGGGRTAVEQAAKSLGQAAAALEIQENKRRRRGGNVEGGPGSAGEEARERALNRYERGLTAQG